MHQCISRAAPELSRERCDRPLAPFISNSWSRFYHLDRA